jgi:HD-like signal output (HDOD) protein
MATREETLEKILSRMKLVGDLPIFSASINRVRRISADPDSDAMKLAKEIMKDANLSVKVLRLANSPFYNRGRGRIGVISRAVVVLGFQTLKNISLTLKLIESFQHEHPSIDMGAMLVRSYLSAGFVQELALKCGVKDVEESYTCALLHRLGEVAVAYFLPNEYARIQELQNTTVTASADIQHTVLGTGYAAIGQALASTWEFPSTVVQTMGQYNPETDGGVRDKTQLNRAMASLANRIVGTVYNLEHSNNAEPLGNLFEELATLTGVGFDRVQNSFTESFKMSCNLAEEYGLNKDKLMPAMRESGDSLCDTLARQFSYYASAGSGADGAGNHTAVPAGEEKAAVSPGSMSVKSPEQRASAARGGLHSHAATVAAAEDEGELSVVAKGGANLDRQLEVLQEITSLISEGAGITMVFTKVVEGLHDGVGFDHAMLCLVNRDRTAYAARIALGDKAEALKEFFQHPIDVHHDLFSKVLVEGNDLLVNNAADISWRGILPEGFTTTVATPNFAIAPMRIEQRPVGFFYVDKSATGAAITDEDYRGFIQFVSQAKLALKMIGRRTA